MRGHQNAFQSIIKIIITPNFDKKNTRGLVKMNWWTRYIFTIYNFLNKYVRKDTNSSDFYSISKFSWLKTLSDIFTVVEHCLDSIPFPWHEFASFDKHVRVLNWKPGFDKPHSEGQSDQSSQVVHSGTKKMLNLRA